MDKIILKGMKFYAFHGVYEEEQEKGQEFIIDAELSVDLRKAGASDHLEDTLDYSKLYAKIENITVKNKFRLIEKLAEEISREILSNFRETKEVRICVKKPHAPMEGNFEWAGVEVVRSRDEG